MFNRVTVFVNDTKNDNLTWRKFYRIWFKIGLEIFICTYVIWLFIDAVKNIMER
jgi:hypothetical protein